MNFVQINRPNNRLDYMSLGKTIANGLRWRLEYAKRHDGLYNVWMPVVDLHQNRTVDIFWEIVHVAETEKEARAKCADLLKQEKPSS